MAKRHIKPYVNPKVYMECLQQMTRGLPERVAQLETHRELKALEKHVTATQQAAQN